MAELMLQIIVYDETKRFLYTLSSPLMFFCFASPQECTFVVREMLEMNTQGTYEHFAEEWKQSMMKAFDVARTNIGKSAQYNKKYFDKKANAVEIDIGDAVQ